MMLSNLKKYRIILASGSPRRQQLLSEMGIAYTVDVRAVEEVYPAHLKGADIALYLAELKSKAFANLQNNDLVITSDTIVWFDNQALGKPTNKEDAYRMLSKLSGKQHAVYTAICLKGKDFTKTVVDQTLVSFANLSPTEIEFYIENYQPFDKAGSYGIQDWIGLIGVDSIQGSYFNVVGLPVHKLYKELKQLA